MKKYFYFLHAFAAAALLSSAAVAQPNAVGWTGIPEGVRIGCDELSQIMDIADAGKTSSDAWTAKFMEFHNTKDALGEPSCMVGDIPIEVTYKQEVDLGVIPMSGHPEHLWAVEAVAGKSDFWITFEEPIVAPAGYDI
jgi:hypothetical protein